MSDTNTGAETTEATTGDQRPGLVLWSDEPATSDLLAFDAIAATVVDALFDESLNPVALGVSGSWGSGKTTVLNLIAGRAEARSEEGTAVLVVRADPWRYDPTVGPRESLIAEILKALQGEFKGSDPIVKSATEAFKKLVKRVNWSKALKMTARTALTAQLPSLDDVMGLVSDEPDTLDSEKGMDAFREEFKVLLAQPALDHVAQVVVLVDDLDRCLPDTVVETLEAIRLFLSAEGMSFVIAADETRVAEAIQQKLNAPAPKDGTESVASLYLHKIVQTTVPVPALSYFDTRAYLFLLLAASKVGDTAYAALVDRCNELRLAAGSLDDLVMPDAVDLSMEVATASRLTPILYEKFTGNPRRIKRFMNDLNVRTSVAGRRGIDLPPDAIAKLMVIERLFPKDFDELLGWLAAGQLRGQLEALKAVAEGEDPVGDATGEVTDEITADAPAEPQDFSGTMVRWAKLPPTLDASQVSGYLTLAAAFQGKLLIDDSLPEKLRDIAAAILSNSQVDRLTVDKDELAKLPPGDVVELAAYLGRRMRDDPSVQITVVNALVTLAELHQNETEQIATAVAMLPASELGAATVLLLKPVAVAFDAVLARWADGATGQAATAIKSVRKAG